MARSSSSASRVERVERSSTSRSISAGMPNQPGNSRTIALACDSASSTDPPICHHHVAHSYVAVSAQDFFVPSRPMPAP